LHVIVKRAGRGTGAERLELLRLFRGWHAPVEVLIEATDASAPCAAISTTDRR
jgi:hypothetical protein